MISANAQCRKAGGSSRRGERSSHETSATNVACKCFNSRGTGSPNRVFSDPAYYWIIYVKDTNAFRAQNKSAAVATAAAQR